jgi:hypothetical protein
VLRDDGDDDDDDGDDDDDVFWCFFDGEIIGFCVWTRPPKSVV